MIDCQSAETSPSTGSRPAHFTDGPGQLAGFTFTGP